MVTEGHVLPLESRFSDKSAQIEGSVAADVVYAEENGALRSFPVELPVKVRISGETLSQPMCGHGCAVRSLRWMRARSIPARCASQHG